MCDDIEVFILVLYFILLPVIPYITQRLAKNLGELLREECLAVFGAVVECQYLVDAILHHEIVDETSAIEIGIGTRLEVLGRAF